MLRQWNHSMKYFLQQRIKRIKLIKRFTLGITNPTERYVTKKGDNFKIVSFLYIASPPALSLERELITNWMRDEGLFAYNLSTY